MTGNADLLRSEDRCTPVVVVAACSVCIKKPLGQCSVRADDADFTVGVTDKACSGYGCVGCDLHIGRIVDVCRVEKLLAADSGNSGDPEAGRNSRRETLFGNGFQPLKIQKDCVIDLLYIDRFCNNIGEVAVKMAKLVGITAVIFCVR